MRLVKSVPPTVLVASLAAAGVAILRWVENYLAFRGTSDFKIYYLGAWIGLTRGWPHIYDPGLQAAGWKLLGDGFAQLAQPDRSFLSPPFVAWLVAPFTALTVPAGYLLWSALIFVGVLLAGLMLTTGPAWWRSAQLAAVLWLGPLYLALILGQIVLIVLVSVAGCWWLLRHGRPAWAGLALVPMLLKPNTAFLVPPALLLLGQTRALLVWLAVAVGLSVLAVIVVGPGGVGLYLHQLQADSGRPFNTSSTLESVIGTDWATRMAQAFFAGLALFAGWRQRRRGPELPLAAALAGSLLASPYLHPYDFSLLLLAGWLVLRSSPPRWFAAGLVLSIPAAEAIFFYGSVPLLAVTAALVIAIAVQTTRGRDVAAGPVMVPV